MRHSLAAITGALLALAPLRAAHAEDITVEIQVLDQPTDDPNNEDSWRLPDDIEAERFLNAAACTCSTPVRVRLTRADLTDTTGNVELWVGPRCDDTSNIADRDARCELITTKAASSFDTSAVQTEIIDSAVLMFPKTACAAREGTAQIWALIDREQDQAYESVSKSVEFSADTEPPPLPTGITASGAENAVVLRWTLPTSRTEDLLGFQVLCSVNGQPLYTGDDVPDAEFDLGCGVIGGSATAALGGGIDAGVPDAAPAAIDAAPAGDAATTGDAGTPPTSIVDPAFLCTGLQSATATSVRISLPSSLELGPDDVVVMTLVAIDDHENPLATAAGSARPQPATDFWEDYQNSGGSAEGGFCFVATAAYGDYDHPFVRVLRDFRDGTLAHFGAGRAFIAWYYANSPPVADFIRRHPAARVAMQVALWPLVVVAGAWEYTSFGDKLVLLGLLVLMVLRRRLARRGETLSTWLAAHRRAATAALGVTTLIVLVGGARVAGADPLLSVEDEEFELPDSRWAFELKFGPYHPDVDGESGLDGAQGPYERMFCQDDESDCQSLMMMLELDWFFAYPAGQLGLAAQAGYMQNTASAFLQNADGSTDYTMRSPGDDTVFHLVPTSLSLVYRFTYVADHTVIPLVPYAKLGLAYGIWWIEKGDGSVTETEEAGKARGGTLGWTGTIGISLRGDMLDPDATRALQTELGVEHAGFFFEGTYLDMSGLGQSNKLRVGDLTWFAGINFEF